MQTLNRFKQVLERIRAAEKQFNRTPGSVHLLAVSKTQPAATIEALYKLGQCDFGENYPQEALHKIRSLVRHPIQWHFIGQIQSNKTRIIAEHFDWVHSVDRFRIAKRLNDQRPENFKPLDICLQINLQDEPGKGGTDLEQLPLLTAQVATLPRLKLRGLMCIPLANTDFNQQRRIFAQLRQAQLELLQRGYELDTLSMGMSNDLEAAIAEGATLVRVGSALFGPRG